MPTFEVDVEIRVRKTLHLSGPHDEAAARQIVEDMLAPGGIGTWPLQKKESDGASFPQMRPVETIIDNQPQIVAIRRVAE